jgi:hypothetical protein
MGLFIGGWISDVNQQKFFSGALGQVFGFNQSGQRWGHVTLSKAAGKQV